MTEHEPDARVQEHVRGSSVQTVTDVHVIVVVPLRQQQARVSNFNDDGFVTPVGMVLAEHFTTFFHNEQFTE